MSSSNEKWYWYIEQPFELLLDCDKPTVDDVWHRIRILEREWNIKFHGVSFYLSQSPGHFHARVSLYPDLFDKFRPRSPREYYYFRCAIACLLGSDRHRETIATGQALIGRKNQFLVVNRLKFIDRTPNHVCSHENWRTCECLRKLQPYD